LRIASDSDSASASVNLHFLRDSTCILEVMELLLLEQLTWK
ncbi:hypothetical protein A2U01_0110991, partial [Trifolium medium]|nr:hypothetical protein [Trifolium medium]